MLFYKYAALNTKKCNMREEEEEVGVEDGNRIDLRQFDFVSVTNLMVAIILYKVPILRFCGRKGPNLGAGEQAPASTRWYSLLGF